jgi:hypothetical protein
VRAARWTLHKFWPTCAIGLGVWEGTAITTRRIPTVTDACRRARQHRAGRVVIALWLLGLAEHMLRSKPKL